MGSGKISPIVPWPDEIEILPTDRVDGLDAGDETPGSVEVGPHSDDHNKVHRIVNSLQEIVLELMNAPAPSGGGGGGQLWLPSNLVATTPPSSASQSANHGANMLVCGRAVMHKAGTLHDLSMPVYVIDADCNARGVIYGTDGQRKWLGDVVPLLGGDNGWKILGDPDLDVAVDDQLFFGFAADQPVTISAGNIRGGNNPFMPPALLPSGNGYLDFILFNSYPPPASINFNSAPYVENVPCLVARIA